MAREKEIRINNYAEQVAWYNEFIKPQVVKLYVRPVIAPHTADTTAKPSKVQYIIYQYTQIN